MISFFGAIKKYLKNLKKERFIIMSFYDDFIILTSFYYYLNLNLIKIKKSKKVNYLNEENLPYNLKVKYFLFKEFFPFKYNIVFDVASEYAYSSYLKVRVRNINKKNKISVMKILSRSLSNYILEILEVNKMEALRANKLQENTITLAQNSIIDIEKDTLFFLKNKNSIVNDFFKEKLSIGIMQTFLNRELIINLKKIIFKKRILNNFFYEKNFYEVLNIYINKIIKNKLNKKIGIIVINEYESYLYICSKEFGIKLYDKIYFGFNNMYNAFNNKFYINKKTFKDFIAKIYNGNISNKTKKEFMHILNEEFSEFDKCINNFKKSSNVNDVYIEAGDLYYYIKARSKLSKKIINYSDYNINNIKIYKNKNILKRTFSLINNVLLIKENGSSVDKIVSNSIKWLLPNF